MLTESPDVRLKRLRMRSSRRGIREMDIILGDFARRALGDLRPRALDLYEELLEENDHDLYQWVSGRAAAPERYLSLVARIAAHQSSRGI